jgi:DNA integrity scanning protein DisA with diadenylate cyclase activity
MIEKLVDTLRDVVKLSGKDFSGIGVIVWNEEFELPIFPLRVNAKIPNNEKLAKNLAQISSLNSDLHDGFHILTPTLKLVRVAQYFSPPIVHDISLNRERRFGGRYLAALFGSKISGVVLSAIATPALGIAIFKNGHEVYFEGP